ncbi:MAG: 2-C-methyl-D-erythritol 2,4-cyclodiphosphate synthase [Actinomycetota bacterium]
MAEVRVGLGFDSHARDPNRPLTLAGARFDGEAGLAGHSDADVVCHALADALFGAAALGDLGAHFPEEDQAFADLAGLELLARSVAAVRAEGLAPESCDLVVVAERPVIADKREVMRANIAGALGVDVSRVSLKATRPEGLSLSGEGAACFAVAVLGYT